MPPIPAFDTLLLAIDQGVAAVTLNRPGTRNLLDPVMFAELALAFRDLDERDDVRAIVLTGAGEHFCAGADLSGGNSIFSKETFERFQDLAREQDGDGPRELEPGELLTPVIAAVNGTAAGGGLTLALQCDLVLVAEDATLALPFTRRGLVAERNAHWNLSRLVGPQRALELLLTGRKFTGREAAEMGLALRALPRGEVVSGAIDLGRGIAAHTAPAATSATKRLIYRALGERDPRAARLLEREVFQQLGASEDCAEGLAAHRERRAPNWHSSKADLPGVLRDGQDD
jgi:enoyl-CoA hydratase/carnithine racemase